MEIYIISVLHGDGSGKTRPVLVIEQDKKFCAAYNITTQYENKSEYVRSKYYPIVDWKAAGLYRESYVDTITLRYFESAMFKNRTPIGRLTEADKAGLIVFLNR